MVRRACPQDDRWPGPLHGAGQELRSVQRVVLAVERERLLRKQPVYDLQLLLEHGEPIYGGREREPELGVLLAPPACTHPDLDSTTRDLIDRGGRPCEDRRRAERYRRHEGSQAQTALSTDVVVRTEERLEPQPLSGLREREPVAPGDALLALDHQAEAHGA